jgi:hypothetical protein
VPLIHLFDKVLQQQALEEGIFDFDHGQALAQMSFCGWIGSRCW